MTCEQIRSQIVAYLSDELDSDTNELIRAHVGCCAACAAEVDWVRQAITEISGVGIRAMPEPVANRIRQEIIDRRRNTGKSIFTSFRVWALAGTLPVVVLLLLGLMLFRQQSLTAAQIIARAETAVTKLTTRHFRYKLSSMVNGRVVTTKYTDIWFKSSGMRRAQEESNTDNHKPTWIKLIRGNEELVYDPMQKVANYRALTVKDLQDEAKSFGPLKPPYDLSRYHVSEARLVGTERVLGRLCDVVTGRMDFGHRLRMSVDRKTGIPLRVIYFDRSVKFFIYEVMVFEPNKAISDDIFQVKLPAGTTVIRGPLYSHSDFPSINLGTLKKPSEAENLMRNSLSLPGVSSLKAAYLPTYLPTGYLLNTVYPDYTRITHRGLNTVYINPKTGGSLLLVHSVRKQPDAGEVVTVQGVGGHISSFTSPYPYSILTWTKQDTHLTLVGSVVGRSELLRIANGLKPLESLVPGLGSGPIWRITTQAVDARKDEYVRVSLDTLSHRLRILGVYDATVKQEDRDHITITARAKNPDLIEKSVLSPGFVSFVPVPSVSAAARYASTTPPLLTQDQVDFRDMRGLSAGKPIFIRARLRYPFYDVRLGKHDGRHASDLLALMLDGRVVGTVTKGNLIAGKQIGPLPADVAATLLAHPLSAKLKVVSREAL